MKLTAQEEYGLRCLLQVARHAPADGPSVASIRDVAEAEGLSADYAAKLLRVLRQAGFVASERGATGGYRLARAATEIPLADVLHALDAPLYDATFCEGYAGLQPQCVHRTSCAVRVLWRTLENALNQALSGLALADLLPDEPDVERRMATATSLTAGPESPRVVAAGVARRENA
jgi:Rrf2 family protein